MSTIHYHARLPQLTDPPAYPRASRAWWDVLMSIRDELQWADFEGREILPQEMAMINEAFTSALWRDEPGVLSVQGSHGALTFAVTACEDESHPVVGQT